MTATENSTITVKAGIQAPAEKVWEFWTNSFHIIKWCSATEEWQTPYSENDLRTGGRFLSRMEAKDGSVGFDFSGVYTNVENGKLIEYTLDDGRKVSVEFVSEGDVTTVIETFEPEGTNPIEMQRAGWQAIMDNFKKYAENHGQIQLLKFETNIAADVKKVYDTMLADETYRAWTALFNPSSFYRGSWEKGSKILFIGTGEDGAEGGMVSRIRENIPSKFVSIEHLGMVQNGEEITTGPEIEAWAGALENYAFAENNGGTLLTVAMDSNEAYKSYFEETWPKALAKLKELCEA